MTLHVLPDRAVELVVEGLEGLGVLVRPVVLELLYIQRRLAVHEEGELDHCGSGGFAREGRVGEEVEEAMMRDLGRGRSNKDFVTTPLVHPKDHSFTMHKLFVCNIWLVSICG